MLPLFWLKSKKVEGRSGSKFLSSFMPLFRLVLRILFSWYFLLQLS
jgi:hypothetical protein